MIVCFKNISERFFLVGGGGGRESEVLGGLEQCFEENRFLLFLIVAPS